MTATMAAQMFSGKNVAGNFLGLKSAGNALTQKGLNKAAQRVPTPFAPTAAGAKAAQGAGMLGKGAGGLLQAGSALSMLGGPVGIAAGVGITAAITGFMLYKNAAEEAEKRAVAAFAEPAKTAEFFGTTLTDTVQQMKDLQTTMEDTQDIDTGLRDAVKEDYSVLIEKLRFSGAEAGARELSLTFNKMIASGLSEESAVAAVEAIAVESGAAGGAAFAIAYKEGLLEAKTPEEVAQNLASAFDPELMEKNSKEIEKTINELRNPLMGFAGNIAESFDNGFGDAMTTLASFQSNINPQMRLLRAGINMAPEDHPVTQFFQGLVSGITDQDAMKASIDASSNYSRGMEQLYANLAENLDVSSTQLVSAVETLFGTFKDAPTETLEAFRQIEETALSMENVEFDPAPIQEFLTTLDPLTAITLNPLIQDNEELAYQIMEGVTAGMSLQEILQAIQNGSLDAEIDIKVNTQEAINKVNDLKTALSEALGADLTKKLEVTDNKIEGLDKQIGRVEKSLEKGTEKLQENFEATQEASDAAIEAMQDESDLIQEKIDKRREETQEKIDSLNKEKDGIVEATDAYINSIQKRQRVDSFYANQRKTAFSALQKLASGDVFGFLQARTEMGQEAQQFSYDNQIQSIEDRREKEVNAIEDTIEKEQERQEQFEKNQQDKIDLINDQMDAERDLQESRQKTLEADLENFKTLKEERIADLQDARAKEQVKREGIQKAIDAAEAQQIVSAQDLAKTLGPELAKPYIEEQKALIRTIYLQELKKANATEQGALDVARSLLQTMYAGPDRTQGGGMQFDNASIKEFLGLGTFVPNRANGGPISGPGGPKSDVIPAMLSNGEYVVQASSVKKYGTGLMDAINTQKFAEGGVVEGGPGTAERSGPITAERGSFNFAFPKFVEGRIFPKKNKPKPDPGTGTGSPPPGGVTTNPPVAPGMDNILSLAQRYSHLEYSGLYPIPTDKSGNPTAWGCATSVAWLYKNGAGITLPSPSLSYGQYAGLKQTVSRSNIAPGDLIFYKNDGPTGVNKQNPVNHVEMYMGGGRVFNGGVGIQSGFSNHPVIAIKRPSKFAAGGFVGGMSGPRSDTVPALLSSGEYVMKSNAVDKYGRGFMDQINSGNFNMPSFGMPSMPTAPSSSIATTVNGGTSSTNNSSSNVKIVINGASGKSATAIANKVASMINSSNNRRNHSRSI
jgi:hypothetical protein